MKSIIVDTNVLLRFLLNDIPHQAKECEQLLIKAKNNEIKLYVARATIFEIDFILRKYYGYEKVVVIDHLKPLISAPYLIVESRILFNRAIIFYKTENISFVDAFLLVKAETEKAELFTFDQALQKLQNRDFDW